MSLFQGVQPHNPASAPNLPLTDGSSRIVTNVSSQRFATSATSSGTTITFGRAPPNVTISNCVPPPLTKIATEGSSSHVTTTTNVTVEPHNQLAIHAVSAVQTASVSVPPPFSSSSVLVPPVSRPSFGSATPGQLPVGAGYRPATSPPVYPRQVLSANPGGVIRHPGVHPNPPGTPSAIQVKPNSGTPPPPPPLVPNARVGPQGIRPQGMYVPAQSSSSSMPQPRPGLHSHPTSYNPIAVRSGVVNHRPQGTAPPPLSSSPGVPSGVPQTGMGERGVRQPGAASMSQRPIMPNYHGIPRSMNPPQGAPPSMRFSSAVRTPLGSGYARQPPPMRPHGGPPGTHQQVRWSYLSIGIS